MARVATGTWRRVRTSASGRSTLESSLKSAGDRGLVAEHLDLGGLDLSDLNVDNATFLNCNFCRSVLSNLHLCKFYCCDLSNSFITDAQSTLFHSSVLNGVSLGTHVRWCDFLRCDLSSCFVLNVTRGTRASLSSCNFVACDMRHADLRGVIIKKCQFASCDFRTSRLSRMRLVGGGLRDSDVSGANLFLSATTGEQVDGLPRLPSALLKSVARITACVEKHQLALAGAWLRMSLVRGGQSDRLLVGLSRRQFAIAESGDSSERVRPLHGRKPCDTFRNVIVDYWQWKLKSNVSVEWSSGTSRQARGAIQDELIHVLYRVFRGLDID